VELTTKPGKQTKAKKLNNNKTSYLKARLFDREIDKAYFFLSEVRD
jgi:hypothetical protein